MLGNLSSGSLWKYYRDEPNASLWDSESSKYKIKKQEVSLLMVIQKIKTVLPLR